jgi:hypothetical protein
VVSSTRSGEPRRSAAVAATRFAWASALHDERLRPGPATAPASEHGANPSDHLADGERLHHVIVGPELETDDAVGHRPARRDHDDRHIGVAPQPAADVTAVAVRKGEIEQNHARIESAHELERLGPRSGDGGRVAGPGQGLGERLGNRLLVLDEQDGPAVHAVDPRAFD